MLHVRVSALWRATRESSDDGDESQPCGSWFRNIGHEAVGSREGVDGGVVAGGYFHSSKIDLLAQVADQGGEIVAVDDSVVIEVSLVPCGGRLAEVAGENGEVIAADDAVEIDVAEKGEFDFELAGGKAGGVISAVGVAESVMGVESGFGCNRAVDSGPGPGSAIASADEIVADGENGIGADP